MSEDYLQKLRVRGIRRVCVVCVVCVSISHGACADTCRRVVSLVVVVCRSPPKRAGWRPRLYRSSSMRSAIG
jgi:hypothetical protein